MAVTVLNPSADIGNPYDPIAPTIHGGSASAHDALGDTNNATYLQYIGGSGSCGALLDYGNLTGVTAGNKYIHQVQIALRLRSSGVGNADFYVFFVDPQGRRTQLEDHYTQYISDFSIFGGVWHTLAPDGKPWTLSSLNSVYVRAVDTNLGSTLYQLSELVLNVDVRSYPKSTLVANPVSLTTQPTFNWSYFSDDDAPQVSYRVQIRSDATGALVVDSGVQNGSATSWQVPKALSNGASYSVRLTVYDGLAWQSVASTGHVLVNVEAPAMPFFALVSLNDPPGAVLSIASSDNLLTYDSSSGGEGGLSTTAGTNVTLTNPTGMSPLQGTHVFRATADAAGTVAVAFDYQAIPVRQGLYYAGAVSVRPAGARRACSSRLTFFDQYGAIISYVDGPDVTEIPSGAGFTQVVVPSCPSPLGAVLAALTVYIKGAATGEVHDLDCATVTSNAYNLVRNPLGSLDTDGDGLGDSWNSLIYGGGTITHGYVDFGPLYGDNWCTFTTANNSNYAGVVQHISLPDAAAGQYGYALCWVYSIDDCNIRFNVDQIGMTEVHLAPNTLTPLVITGPIGDVVAANGFSNVYIATPDESATVRWTGVQVGISPNPFPTIDPSLVIWTNNWTRGGIAGMSTHDIERSDDGGFTWSDMRRTSDNSQYASGLQTYVVIDYEVAPGTTNVVYRVRKTYTDASGPVFTSPWARYRHVPSPITPSTYWLVSTSDATLNASVNVEMGLKRDRVEPQGVMKPLGRSLPVTVRGKQGGDSGTMTIECVTEAEYDDLVALRALQETLWMASPVGRSMYVDLGPSAENTVQSDSYSETTVSYTEVKRPPVRVVESAPVVPPVPVITPPPTAPTFTGLFDDTTLPTLYAGWSVRALSRAALTTNKAVTVTRASDHTTQDIGFTSSGNLHTTALATFCSGTSGVVTKWWDQSGNGFHLTCTEAKGWTIYSGGAVSLPPTGNALPTLKAADTARGMITSGPSFTGNKVAGFVVGASQSAGTTLAPRFLSLINSSLADNDTGHSGAELVARNGTTNGSTGFRIDRGSGPQASAAGANNTLQQVTSTAYDGVPGGYQVTVDGAAGTAATVSLGNFNTTRLGLGHTGLTEQSVAGQCCSEMLLFTSQLSASQAGTIAVNQKTYFGTATQTVPTPAAGGTLVASDSLSSQTLPLPSGEWEVYDQGHSTGNAAAWLARDVLKSGDTLILQGKKNTSPITVNGQQYLRECPAVYWLGAGHAAQLDQGIFEVQMRMDGNSQGWGVVLMTWAVDDVTYPWPTGREYDIIEIFSGNASKQGGESYLHYDTTPNTSRAFHAPTSTSNSSASDVAAGNYQIDWTQWHTVQFKWVRGSLMQVFIDGVSKAQVNGSSYNPVSPANQQRFGVQIEGYGTSDAASTSLFTCSVKGFKAYSL